MVGAASATDPYIVPILPGYPQGYNYYAGRTQVAPSQNGTTAVIVTAGDSTVSNVVNALFTPVNALVQNFNIYTGGCYTAQEPLLGCNTNSAALYTSGCYFTRVADSLITASTYTKVIIVPIGLGGSLFADYASGGSINGIFSVAQKRLASAGLTATAIFFQCGANDTNAGTSSGSCNTSMASIVSTIQGVWPSTKIFVPTHSIFGLATSANVTGAQATVLNSGALVYTGGNLDSITAAGNYWDNTHYNATGAAAAASLVVSAIQAHP